MPKIDQNVLMQYRALMAEHIFTVGFLSDPSVIRASLVHKSLVSLGWAIVPIMLGELRYRNTSFRYYYLFLMLEDIVGDVVDIPEEHYGSIDRITEYWVTWAEDNEVI